MIWALAAFAVGWFFGRWQLRKEQALRLELDLNTERFRRRIDERTER